MKKHTIIPYLTGLLLSAIVLSGGCKKHSAEDPGATPGNGIITLTTMSPIFEAEGGDVFITFHSTAAWTAVGGAYVHYKQEEVRHLYADRKH